LNNIDKYYNIQSDIKDIREKIKFIRKSKISLLKRIYKENEKIKNITNKNQLTKGNLTYLNGDIYKGKWNKGMFYGICKFTNSKGNTYEGNFVNNKMHGFGKLIYANGNIYEGNFVNNKMHGFGKLIYINSVIKSIDAYWINKNTFDKEKDVKFEYDDNLLKKINNLRTEIQSFDILPNILHRYIPVLDKKTKISELKYILKKEI